MSEGTQTDAGGPGAWSSNECIVDLCGTMYTVSFDRPTDEEIASDLILLHSRCPAWADESQMHVVITDIM